jgi:hypothetical protein
VQRAATVEALGVATPGSVGCETALQMLRRADIELGLVEWLQDAAWERSALAEEAGFTVELVARALRGRVRTGFIERTVSALLREFHAEMQVPQ